MLKAKAKEKQSGERVTETLHFKYVNYFFVSSSVSPKFILPLDILDTRATFIERARVCVCNACINWCNHSSLCLYKSFSKSEITSQKSVVHSLVVNKCLEASYWFETIPIKNSKIFRLALGGFWRCSLKLVFSTRLSSSSIHDSWNSFRFQKE